MHKVSVSLHIELISESEKTNLIFTESWNFSVDKYNFRKINDKEVEVTFSFEANLEKRDEQGTLVTELPSIHTEQFQDYEVDLEIILDLISLHTSYGVRIKKDSYSFSSHPLGRGISSSDNEIPPHNVSVDLKDTVGLSKRYGAIIASKKESKRLINALRQNRYSLFIKEPGEQIPKLWGALEQLFGKQKGKLLTDNQLKIVKKIIGKTSGISKEKKEIILKRISDTPLKSVKELLVERVKLMNAEGVISSEETRAILTFWYKKRSTPAHGEILPKRGEEIDFAVWEMEATIQSLLYSELKPKMIQYLLFKKNGLNEEFIKRKGKLLSKLQNNYFALPIRQDEIEIYLQHIPNEIKNNTSSVFIVSHSTVTRLDKSTAEIVNVELLDTTLRGIIEKIRKNINRE